VNLLFITLDGARIDSVLKSITIGKLRQKGTVFTNVIAYAPYTIAAMHAIFSGEYGFRTGVNSYWSTYKFKKDQYKTLAQYLQENGFRTFGDAINELVLPPQGFEKLDYHNEDEDDLTIRHKKLLDKMKELESKGDKFFLYLHYSNIHTNIKHNVLKRYNNFSQEYFDHKSSNEGKYDEYFKAAESYVKEIIEYCERINLIQDTLIILISDHGISVGEKFGERAYGAFCYDYTIRTFMLLLKEGLFPTKIVTHQVRSIDIFPTILDIFKIPQDSLFNKISGESLIPLIQGESDERSAIIETGNPLQSNRPPKEPNVIAIRKNNWKLILNLHNNSREFYNLANDPSEEINLHNDENKIEKELFNELVKACPHLENNDKENLIAEKLAELGYWTDMYSKPNVFGEGPTKLAIIAHEIMKKNNTKTILELGCGQGRDSIFFAESGYSVTATDFATSAIEFVGKKTEELKLFNLYSQVQDFRQDFEFKQKYDCVYSNLAFQFFNKDELITVFGKVASCLSPNGLFIFSTKKPGDKYYQVGEKIDENTYKMNGVIRYFFSKNVILELLKEKFDVKSIREESHTNQDGSISVWWYVIANLL